MRFTANRTQLLSAASFAASAIGGRSTLPVLSHLLITADAGRVRFNGTNLDVHTSAKCEADIGNIGSTCAPTALFISFLKNAPANEIAVEQKKRFITLTAGKSRAELSVIPAKEYPTTTTKAVTGSEIKLPAATLKTALDQVRRCQSDGADGRPTLCSVFFELQDGKLSLVATDGRRAAVSQFEAEGTGSYVVPTGIVDRLAGAISSGEVRCVFSENAAEFSGESWSISGKLIDGTYPNYRQVIPGDSKQVVSIPKEDLVAAIRRVKPFTTEKASSIKLAFGNRSLAISARGTDHGAQETIEDIEADAMSIALNPDYLLDLIAGVPGDLVRLGLTDELSPVVIREGTYTGVMMPMRLA